MSVPPFEKTECSCQGCQAFCCKPGHINPDQLQGLLRTLDAQGNPAKIVRARGWLAGSSTGSNAVLNVPVATPAVRASDGRCVYLSAEGRCVVHEIKPYGCAYFDSHMSKQEGDRRSLFFLREIQGDGVYNAFITLLDPSRVSPPK